MSKKSSRRQFIRLASASAITGGLVPGALAKNTIELNRSLGTFGANEQINLALIGAGGQGMGDALNAIKVDGVKMVGAADCYDGRLRRCKSLFGDEIQVTKQYEELIDRSDVDAIIIGTPDHWHAKIAKEAMRAGKAVYCEKPMVHDISEGPDMIAVQKETGQLLQVGSQRVSSIAYEKAKELYESGIIGTLNMVEAKINRNSAMGAWQYTIPPDASPETCDWDMFLGDAPKRDFDATRFFRWRNYWDYGTGLAGDLFVHLFSGIHFVLSSHGPTRVYSTGGLRHWKDGRDSPDIQMALFDYPETDNHPAFNMTLQVNFADGAGGGSNFRFVGDQGVITIEGQSVIVDRMAKATEPGISGWSLPQDQVEAYMVEYRQRYPEPERASVRESGQTVYAAPRGYSDSEDHFVTFFKAMRADTDVVENVEFGYRAAAASLMCNVSYRNNEVCHWDPVKMEMLNA